MGPTAQDFYAAFDLGRDDTSISTVDEGGVALAAIQGLYKVVQEQERELTELRRVIKTRPDNGWLTSRDLFLGGTLLLVGLLLGRRR